MGKLIGAIAAKWYALPQPVRSAVVDAVETGVGAALGVQLILPADAHGWVQVGATLVAAFGSAALSALRRSAQNALNTRRAAAAAKLDTAAKTLG